MSSMFVPRRLEAFVQLAKATAEQMAEQTARPTDEAPRHFTKNSIAMTISREMALIHGMVDPTPEERAQMDKEAAEHDVKRRESWRIYDAARPALDAIADPLARAILDLHHSDTIEGPHCQGCDMDGYECEAPEWPCRTVEAVAKHYAIELPNGWHLYRRP